MKPGGPLKRRKKLPPGAPLERHSPMPKVSAKKLAAGVKPQRPRRQPAVPDAVRAVIRKRSGGWCETQRPGCWGAATDPSHRITSKNGGRHGAAKERHDRPSNVMYDCRPCHDWKHANPERAKKVGLMLEEWQKPTEEPVLYRGRMVFLGDAGEIGEYEAVGT